MQYVYTVSTTDVQYVYTVSTIDLQYVLTFKANREVRQPQESIGSGTFNVTNFLKDVELLHICGLLLILLLLKKKKNK